MAEVTGSARCLRGLFALLLCGGAQAGPAQPACLAPVLAQPSVLIHRWVCAADVLPAESREHTAARLQALVIRTSDHTWVVDPGATAAQGRALLHALQPAERNRESGPHRLTVINSRAQAEHVMASEVLVRQWKQGLARHIALPETSRLMQKRCVPCRQRLERELGRAAMRETRIRIPVGIDASKWPTEAPFLAISARNAAIEEDTWFEARDKSWVWVGLLLNARGVPDLQQGLLQERMAVLTLWLSHSRQHPDTVWWNSTGDVAVERIALERAYFARWEKAARTALDEGLTSLETLAHLRHQPEPLLEKDPASAPLHELNLQRIIRQAEESLFR